MAKNFKQKPNKDLLQAQQKLSQNNPAKAIKILEKLFKTSSINNLKILYLMGLAYGKMGQFDKVVLVSTEALKINSEHYGALCNLANGLFYTGNMQAALEKYKKVLTLKSGETYIVDNYCRALNSLGRQKEAIKILDSLLKKQPLHAPAYIGRGIAYAEIGQFEIAKQSFEKALKINPLSVDANLGMGNLCRFKGDLLRSEKHYRAILDVDQYHALAYVGLATVKRLAGELELAIETITKADLRIPEHKVILAAKADIFEHAGKFDEAFELLEKLKKHGQLTALGVSSFANMCHRFDVCNEAVKLLSDTIQLSATNNLEKEILYFTSGKLLDKLGRYDDAFEHYLLANTSVDIKFNEIKELAFVNESINVYTQSAIEHFPRAKTGSTRPIFILGMPRSGTSLTEQILAAHPDVYGAGELSEIMSISNAIRNLKPDFAGDYANCIPGLSSEAINKYANQYLESISLLNTTQRYVTDKMPHNFMYIGLITLLFPDARIIHCTRNPLDSILSVYFQNFSGGHSYSTNLKNITLFYNAYHRLMKHWKDVINIPIHTVKYEEIVEDQEKVTRELLEFCELDWDDNVLQFHKSKRNVGTASYEQVRQPIYKTSKERWRNYEKHLDIVKKTLCIT